MPQTQDAQLNMIFANWESNVKKKLAEQGGFIADYAYLSSFELNS